MQEFSFHIKTAEPEAAGFLARGTGLSKTRIKEIMNKGAIWLERYGKTRRLRRAKATLQPADTVNIYYDEKVIDAVPPEPRLIKDNKAYSVWCKPPGLLSSGSRFGDHCAINRWVESNLKPERPVFIVHRLDRMASGLMVLAHTKQTAARLSEQFQKRAVTKRYIVEVQGDYVGSNTINESLDGRAAISHIKVVKNCSESTTLLVSIETGRKHQIRRHLSGAGYPVLGDHLYGGPDSHHLHLEAVFLEFTCPVSGETVIFQSEFK